MAPAGSSHSHQRAENPWAPDMKIEAHAHGATPVVVETCQRTAILEMRRGTPSGLGRRRSCCPNAAYTVRHLDRTRFHLDKQGWSRGPVLRLRERQQSGQRGGDGAVDQGGAWTSPGMSSGGTAGANSQPWPVSQPSLRSRVSWAGVSTDSAVTVRPRMWASRTTVATISRSTSSVSSLPLVPRVMNGPASFRVCTGSRRR